MFVDVATCAPRAFLLTLIALAIVTAQAFFSRRSPATASADRLRWHWPTYVAAFDATAVLAAALACRMPTSEYAVFDNFVVSAVTAGVGVGFAVAGTSAVEMLASRRLSLRLPPSPVLAAVLAVGLSWTLVLRLFTG